MFTGLNTVLLVVLEHPTNSIFLAAVTALGGGGVIVVSCMTVVCQTMKSRIPTNGMPW